MKLAKIIGCLVLLFFMTYQIFDWSKDWRDTVREEKLEELNAEIAEILDEGPEKKQTSSWQDRIQENKEAEEPEEVNMQEVLNYILLFVIFIVIPLSIPLTVWGIFKKREETKQSQLDFEREKWLQAQAEKERDKQ